MLCRPAVVGAQTLLARVFFRCLRFLPGGSNRSSASSALRRGRRVRVAAAAEEATMFWKDSSARSSSSSGVGPFGQVRVLVVGDSGVGKSSLVHLLLNGSSIARPAQTVGCEVGIKHVTYGSAGGSSNNLSNDAERNFFVELWDVSGHERYKACRSIFYSQINGVIFVYDLSQRKTKTNLNKWAVEVAETGSFAATLASGGPGGLPVPYLVIANKVDLVPRDGTRVRNGSIVDVARQWFEKRGILPCTEELPLTDSFPGSSGLNSATKEARYDKEAVIKFFRMLIRRRYFSNEPAAPSPWSFTPRVDSILPVVTPKDDADTFKRKSYSGEDHMFSGVLPLPAQRNLPPPPTLDPQLPVFSSDNYRYHRYSSPSLTEMSSNRTNREKYNV